MHQAPELPRRACRPVSLSLALCVSRVEESNVSKPQIIMLVKTTHGQARWSAMSHSTDDQVVPQDQEQPALSQEWGVCTLGPGWLPQPLLLTLTAFHTTLCSACCYPCCGNRGGALLLIPRGSQL